MRTSTDAGADTAVRYRAFAEVEARGLSACYEAWAAGVADDPEVIARIDRLPPATRQPNLVFSAARFHGAPTGGYGAFRAWLTANWAAVEQTCRSHATQTNEPGRCAALLPALGGVRGPLALIEVGASAGLCLLPDRYSYRYGPAGASAAGGAGAAGRLDPLDGPSPVLLDCAVTGAVPVPSRLPLVVWRAGIDLNPLDVAEPADVAWLDALIWPEHDDRRARLRAAVQIARRDPPRLVRGDLNERVEALVAEAPAHATVVVFHTAVLAYLDDAGRDRFAATMGRLHRERAVHWLANEGRTVVPGVAETLPVTLPVASGSADFVVSLDGRALALAQPHGRALHWLGERSG
ncbi:DUF2332 domain-containing protein [Cryobacterium sp. 1639]|uniref:DUF2332 domain-containing protein n=1 Tax=Cryobacterium inferilacus TaxID=2866629 RepID=UPI001C73C249|nr:DUF2332 domain-containing protein [Cryobacterium sp. 1639]MBX0298588.1 DUF2332 domain-containing protein [Cryobacterium sp. 1639]